MKKLLVESMRPHKQKSQKFKKEKRPKLKRWFGFLTLIVLAGGLIYWSQTQTTNWWRLGDTGPLDVSGADVTAVLDQKENLSTRDLIILASNLDLDTNASLPIQMQWIQFRLDISRQLLAKSNDEIAQKEGTLYRLEALQLLSNLNRKYTMGNEKVDAELYDVSSANLYHEDVEIAKIAAATLMLTEIHKFVKKPDPTNLQAAVDRCRQFAIQFNDDDEIAGAIFKYARLMKRSDNLVDDALEFFRVVSETYLGSANQVAISYAKRAQLEILYGDETGNERFANLLIVGIKDRFRQQRLSAENEVAKRIRFSLDNELIDKRGVEHIFELMEVLVTNSKLESAAQLTDELQQFFANHPDPAVASFAKSILRDLVIRIKQHDQTFDMSGLVRVIDGKTADGNSELPRLVVYWAPSEKPSVSMVSTLYGQPLKRRIQVIVVCVEQNKEQMELVKKFAIELQDFEFVISDVKQDDNFMARFPVPKFPYLLLLDKNNQLFAINPDLQDLNNRIRDVSN